MHRIVIVGGGVTGLVAAYTLLTEAKERGLPIQCTVIERERRWGGKVRSLRTGGMVIEMGPDAILRRKPWAAELCRRLGLREKMVEMAASGSYVRWGRRLLPLPAGLSFLVPTQLGPFVRSPLFSLAGKVRMGLEYFLPPSRAAGDEALGDFVRRRLGREALERLAEPLLSGIYAGDVDRLSLLATFPQLRAMEEEHGGLLRAALAQRRRARASGAASGQSAFFSLQGGLETLIDTLIERLAPAELVRGDAVAAILPQGHSGNGVRPEESGRYRIVLESGRSLPADGVLLAAPAYVQAELLKDLAPEAARILAGIEYASVAGVVLVYPKSSVGPLPPGTGYVVPRQSGGPVTACTWASEKWPHVAPPGRTLLRCHFGKAGREDVTLWSDERLLEEAKREVAQTMGVTAEPESWHIVRWPRALPQYAVGHLDRIAAVERALESLPGLVATGAAFRGVGVPDCVRQGQEAARALLGRICLA